MEYLTAAEISQKWNISSRMAAYYCKAGRIEGAVKKGKTWFIPANAEKPVDKRFSKRKVHIQENCDFHRGKLDINKADIDNISTIYHTSDVYKNLGLTRETLRYYEEIGLISPKRNQDSQYREFDFFDISHLMAIDFYKKRGFTPLEIRELMKISKPEEYSEIMERQMGALENNIRHLQEMLRRLRATRNFCIHTASEIGEFTIKNFPLYAVEDSMDAISSFGEYRDKVLNYLNLENEDILSNMVRTVTFDETGYKGSGMCIVKPAAKKSQGRYEVFLEEGKCLYTTLSADNNDNSVMEKMFALSHKWAAEHKVSFRGVAYIFIPFIILNDQTERNYYEVWIPLK